ncbi:ion channel protein [Rhizoctonia solani]|uniref:Ion channel protein n=1 Tax=Rhizoctonia solani TaxID=456999 RepID=A0A8H8T0F6_9AGAM|nr:ion channel protein [Rhizoctonia solani]QRW23622.1 ion channel protein [Rhizoctonia solani]
MPSIVLLVPMLQVLFDRRRAKSEESSRGFEAAGETESGVNSHSGITNGRTRAGKIVSVPIWTRIKDYLWGQEADESRGEYTPNFRWTPILSGVIIPFAILLEIPGLTEHWYIRTIGNKTVETQDNSKILDAGLAISMASAVVANVALITRFLERRVRLATFVAIGGLVIHDIINIIAVITFGVVHGVDDGFTSIWTGFLDDSLGAMCYSFIMDLSFQNGLYFTVVSIETVGFGDIVLKTTLGRVFSIFYNTFGIINLGLAVSTTRETIIESFENSYRKRRAEREKLKHSRAQTRVAEQLLRRMGQPVYVPLPHLVDPADTIIYESTRIGERTLTFTSLAESMVHRPNDAGSNIIHGSLRRHPHRMKERLVLNIWALSKEQRNVLFGEQGVTGPGISTDTMTGIGVATNVAGAPLTGTMIRESPTPEDHTPDLPRPGSSTSIANADSNAMTLIEQFHAELGGSGHEEDSVDYIELKERLEREEKKEFAFKLGVAWSLFVAFWLIGSGVFVVTEGWRFGESLFFCFCTFSTVGYGDFAPKTPAGRAFFVGWALFGIAAMTILISVLTEAYSSRYKTIVHSSVLDRAVKSRRQRTLSHSHAPSSPSDMNALAIEIVNNARAMREHMSWFVNSSGMKGAPEGVIKVLDDVAEGENMDERVKKDLMSNDEARKTVFVMSFERMLHNLACVAEEVARAPHEDTQSQIGTGRGSDRQ